MDKNSVKTTNVRRPRFISQFALLDGRDEHRPRWLRRLIWLAIGIGSVLAAYDIFGY